MPTTSASLMNVPSAHPPPPAQRLKAIKTTPTSFHPWASMSIRVLLQQLSKTKLYRFTTARPESNWKLACNHLQGRTQAMSTAYVFRRVKEEEKEVKTTDCGCCSRRSRRSASYAGGISGRRDSPVSTAINNLAVCQPGSEHRKSGASLFDLYRA